MAEGNQPIVIDNGTGVLKAGFAGSDKPRVVFRSCVGRPKHRRVMPGGALELSSDHFVASRSKAGDHYFVGSKVEDHRGSLILSYPIEHGVVQNWDEMESLWAHIYTKENLNVSSEEYPVLLTEAPLNPYRNREKAAEIFFEYFNVPSLFFSLQAVLSLYASGRTTGVVLDSGDGVTHAVPVYEGFALPHAIMRMDLAGKDVTQYLQLLLRREGHVFNTSAELEIVRQIKEKCCIVALNPNDRDLENKKCTYQLPDGSNIEIGPESYKASEILFKPDLIGSEYKGIQDCLVKSIMKSDMDLRRTLFSQIVLSGGSTLFPGYGDRLLKEVRKHSLSTKDTKIRIAAPPERLYTTWIGGSILASLSTFSNMWIKKEEYNERGPQYRGDFFQELHSKCL